MSGHDYRGLAGYDVAEQALRANLSPRHRWLDRLERYVAGTQYEGRKHWLDDSEGPDGAVPLLERAPHVVDPLPREAIQSYVDFIAGDAHWPAVTAAPEEDESSAENTSGLDEQASLALDAGLRGIAEQAKLQQRGQVALERALSAGAVATICGVRAGRLHIEHRRSKFCETTFDRATGDLQAVEIRYPYFERFFDRAAGRSAVRTMLYRRRIDAEEDITFKPIVADRNGDEPKGWTVDKEQTIRHGFGFCPVVWWENGDDEQGRDGRAIHAEQLDELDALNRACSQHNRAGLYAGDPQFAEYGVELDHNPAPGGRAARLITTDDEGPDHPNRRWRLAGTGNAGVRRKGPGVMWRYPDPNSSVELLSLPGDALDSVAKDRDDLRQTIADALGYVDLNHGARNKTGGINFANLSGEAIAWMYRKQTGRCDGLRKSFADGWLLPVLNCLLRIALHYQRRPELGALYLDGLGATAALAESFERDVQGADGATIKRWFGPALRVKWPPYFPPSASDQKVAADQVRADYDAKLITRRTAVEKLAPFYGIENVDAYMEALETEADERENVEHQLVKALNGAATTDDEEAGAKANEKASALGGDGAPGASPKGREKPRR